MTATAFADDPILDRHPTPPAAARRPVPTSNRHHSPGLTTVSGLHRGDLSTDPASTAHLFGPALDSMIETYRRRRFAVALALTAVILVASQLLGLSLTSFGPVAEAEESARVVHVVQPGDTYPAIAASLGATDPNTFAVALRQANGSADLVVGQRIVLDRAAIE